MTQTLGGSVSHSHAEADQAKPRVAEVISFAIADSQYGVEIVAVREIKSWTNVTRLPNQPEYVRGVLNLRGVMVPIIDLRCRFGEGLTQETPLHVVIVVQIRDMLTGILVDRVLDIVPIESKDIQPVPSVVNPRQARLLSGLTTVGDATLALINLENLVPSDVKADVPVNEAA